MSEVPPQYRALADAPKVPVQSALHMEYLAREAERCAACTAPATDRGLCRPHAWYLRVVLADPKYRHEPVPRLVVAGREYGAQEAML